jgi:hypothetical protein
MTPGEAKFLDWAFLILGAILMFSGWRAIAKRRVRSDMGEYEGKWAVRLGWLWIIIGALLVIAVAFDVAILKIIGKLFMESAS